MGDERKPLGSLAAQMTVTSIPPAAEVCDAVDAQWEDHSKVPLVGEYKGPEVVAAGTARVPGRNKVVLEKGHSQMDWMRLMQTHESLEELRKFRSRKISRAELKKHNKPEDAWTALHGKVYDITLYLPFHPGGKEMLMSGAGKDCTSLFQKYHRWVNGGMMLERCQVGVLEEEVETLAEDVEELEIDS